MISSIPGECFQEHLELSKVLEVANYRFLANFIFLTLVDLLTDHSLTHLSILLDGWCCPEELWVLGFITEGTG